MRNARSCDERPIPLSVREWVRTIVAGHAGFDCAARSRVQSIRVGRADNRRDTFTAPICEELRPAYRRIGRCQGIHRIRGPRWSAAADGRLAHRKSRNSQKAGYLSGLTR